MNLDNRKCLYAHELATLLEEHNEIEGRVSTKAREDTTKLVEDRERLLGEVGYW